jgi:outer membrane biogenesis lipoprotein LolB
MKRFLLAALLATGLAGCASLPPPKTDGVASPLNARSEFTMSGRFSARNEREQVSGQFRYAETPTLRTLSLFSPLGTAVADIVATGGNVTLTQANGTTQSAASVSELLRTVIDLPVTDQVLSSWLQGLPAARGGLNAAELTGLERDDSGRPSRFIQSGWEILVSERFPGSGGPKRMRWSLAGQPETEVRWVMDAWNTP